MTHIKLDPLMEKKLEEIGSSYEKWREFIIHPENFKKDPKAHEAANRLLEDLVEDIGNYSSIMAEIEKLVNINKFRTDNIEEYKKNVENLDKYRRAVHNAAIQKFGIINRILAKNLGLGKKIIAEDNSYVGIYPNSPYHLYIDPARDVVVGVTQEKYREEIGQTMLALAYYFGRKNQ